MKPVLFLLFICFFCSCTTTRYYVVRHAEKADATTMMTNVPDVPLSAAGEERAEALRERLKNEGIRHIFSTNYQRTKNTASPLGMHIGIGTQTYDLRDTSFISRLKSMKENTLVVGHSNTVDDIVNGLAGQNLLKDLRDEEYGDLFIVKRKGRKFSFEKSRFGK
jgi:2,3-bisphosphoglycerate-dependent phosphoglycerate mutase